MPRIIRLIRWNSLGQLVNIAGLAWLRCIWKSPHTFLLSSGTGDPHPHEPFLEPTLIMYAIWQLEEFDTYDAAMLFCACCGLRQIGSHLKMAPWHRRSWNEIVSSIFWKQRGCSDPQMTGRETKRCWKASETLAIKRSRFQDWECATRFNCLYLL